MAIRLTRIANAKQLLRQSSLPENHIPKGHFAVCVGGQPEMKRFIILISFLNQPSFQEMLNQAVCVGEQPEMKRFIIPISFLNQPSFQEMLNQAQQEFGFDHPTGALTTACSEKAFINLTSKLNGL